MKSYNIKKEMQMKRVKGIKYTGAEGNWAWVVNTQQKYRCQITMYAWQLYDRINKCYPHKLN